MSLNASAQEATELAPLLQACHAATERMRRTHDVLTREVRHLRDQLATANAALMRSRRLAALGEMAAGIAHEVRNPLASIRLYAGVLEAELADRPAGQQAAQKIAECVRGLDAIVSDVLAFSQDLRPRIELRPMVETVGRAVELLLPMLDAARVQVAMRIDERLELPHDPQLLRQVVVNLVRNAAEAMPDGGRITITGRRDRLGGAVLTVADTGPGIDERDIDRIFNPFFTTRPTGTGLGLAIVHRIIDAHGGAVAVHNEDGAVFTLTFPSIAAERAA